MPIDECGDYCTRCKADRLFRRIGPSQAIPLAFLIAAGVSLGLALSVNNGAAGFVLFGTAALAGVFCFIFVMPSRGPWLCTVCGTEPESAADKKAQRQAEQLQAAQQRQAEDEDRRREAAIAKYEASKKGKKEG